MARSLNGVGWDCVKRALTQATAEQGSSSGSPGSSVASRCDPVAVCLGVQRACGYRLRRSHGMRRGSVPHRARHLASLEAPDILRWVASRPTGFGEPREKRPHNVEIPNIFDVPTGETQADSKVWGRFSVPNVGYGHCDMSEMRRSERYPLRSMLP